MADRDADSGVGEIPDICYDLVQTVAGIFYIIRFKYAPPVVPLYEELKPLYCYLYCSYRRGYVS